MLLQVLVETTVVAGAKVRSEDVLARDVRRVPLELGRSILEVAQGHPEGGDREVEAHEGV